MSELDELEKENKRLHRVIDALHDRTRKAEQFGLDRNVKNLVLEPDNVEWVVNDIAELGVKIGNQLFFMYKGHSLVYSKEDDVGMRWRPVYKREFGETVRVPPLTEHSTDRGELDEEHRYTFGEGWQEIP